MARAASADTTPDGAGGGRVGAPGTACAWISTRRRDGRTGPDPRRGASDACVRYPLSGKRSAAAGASRNQPGSAVTRKT